METKITYLEQLEQDLLQAAERERHLEPAGPAPVHRTGRRRGAFIAAAIAFLVVAGLVGGITKLTSSSSSSAASAGSSGTSFDNVGKAVNGAAGRGQVGTNGGVTVPEPSRAPDLQGNDAASVIGQQTHSIGQGSSAVDLSKIIRTGSMSVTVPRDGLGTSVDEVTAIADKQGGFVFSSSIATRSGLLVLHVPAKRFDAAMTALRKIGVVKGVSIAAQDVTNQFIDLNARLKILEGRRRALQKLYLKAVSISETLRVQGALDQTQQGIEQIQGELNVIQNRTSESTIRVQLREAGVANVTTQTPVHTPSIGNAWDHAIAGFVGVIAAVVIGLGYLIPLAILALLIWFVVTLVRRRRAPS